MKKGGLFILIFICVSCNDINGIKNKFLLNGKVVDSYTNEPVPNIEINYEVCNPIGDIMFNTCVTIDEGNVETDENGEFTILLNYEDKDDLLKFFMRSHNKDYQVNSSQFRYEINYLKNNDFSSLKANRLANIEIIVKNSNPYDMEDQLEIRYFKDSKDLLTNYGFQRELLVNYGVTNVFYDNGNNISSLLKWKGENINSVIKGKLNAAYKEVYIYYITKKNGVFSEKNTVIKLLEPTIENKYLIEF